MDKGFGLRLMTVGVLALASAFAGCGGDDDDSMSDPSGSGASSAMGSGGDGSGGGSACATDVCTTYGAAVPTVAGEIVDRAATDAQFMDDFAPLVAQGEDAVDAFKVSLTNFITDAYGCTQGMYTGPSMPEAHAGMGITQQEYDDFIAIIADVLADNGVPAADIQNCFAPPLVDPAFSGTIVGK